MTKTELEKRIESLEKENIILDSKILELYTLYSISKKLSMATQLEEIFNGTMEHISRSLQIDDFCILLKDESGEVLKVSASHGDVDLTDITLSVGEGLTGKVALTGEKILARDVSKEPEFLFYKGKKKNIGSFLCIPLMGSDGRVIGILNVHKPEVNAFAVTDLELFEEVAGQIAIALDKALSFRNIKELSIRDELTGLYNRRYFFDYFEKDMERAKRYGRELSLIIIDIDYFKNFNDTNGHLLGDKALKKVASLLSDAVRTADVVARFGGEEFVVLLPEVGKDYAMQVAEKLREVIELEKFEGEENQPGGKLTATFGVSSFSDDTAYATELIDCADKALYTGKTKGRNIVSPFTPQ